MRFQPICQTGAVASHPVPPHVVTCNCDFCPAGVSQQQTAGPLVQPRAASHLSAQPTPQAVKQWPHRNKGPTAPESTPPNKRQKVTHDKTPSPISSPNARQLSIMSFLKHLNAASGHPPTRLSLDCTIAKHATAFNSPLQSTSRGFAEPGLTPIPDASQTTPEAQRVDTSLGKAAHTGTDQPILRSTQDTCKAQTLGGSTVRKTDTATPTCQSAAIESSSHQGSSRDGSPQTPILGCSYPDTGREAESVRADSNKGKGLLGPCPLYQPIHEGPCQLDRTKPGCDFTPVRLNSHLL